MNVLRPLAIVVAFVALASPVAAGTDVPAQLARVVAANAEVRFAQAEITLPNDTILLLEYARPGNVSLSGPALAASLGDLRAATDATSAQKIVANPSFVALRNVADEEANRIGPTFGHPGIVLAPRNGGQWTDGGMDVLDGKPMHKYRLDDAAEQTILWIGDDDRIARVDVRTHEGTRTTRFTRYIVGRNDMRA